MVAPCSLTDISDCGPSFGVTVTLLIVFIGLKLMGDGAVVVFVVNRGLIDAIVANLLRAERHLQFQLWPEFQFRHD